MSDRLKLPPERDFGFYQRRKHDKWRAVDAPVLEAPVADSHAHVHMMPDPAWELARCAANGVDFVCEICDPSEDGSRPFDEMDMWLSEARNAFFGLESEKNDGYAVPMSHEVPVFGEKSGEMSATVAENALKVDSAGPGVLHNRQILPARAEKSGFVARIAVGVHPHNAKLYDDAIECELLQRLEDPRVAALGEVGLDFHYDLSPRDVQRSVFRRQIALAKEANLPLVLHLRGGEDPIADNAHREAFEILREEGALGSSTLLHCCALPPDELRPWIEADCYIAYGGAITFKNADSAREGARLVPESRLLLETDSPYMTPEPMRGAACTPAHVVFTAAALAEARGIEPGEPRRAFLQQLHANTLAFYRAI